MTVYDVVKKLVGPIYPVGESDVDEKRYESLEEEIKLVDRMLQNLLYVSQNVHRIEASRRKAGERAAKYLEELREQLNAWKENGGGLPEKKEPDSWFRVDYVLPPAGSIVWGKNKDIPGEPERRFLFTEGQWLTPPGMQKPGIFFPPTHWRHLNEQ